MLAESVVPALREHRERVRLTQQMDLQAGFGATVEQHPMWYVVEAVKV